MELDIPLLWLDRADYEPPDSRSSDNRETSQPHLCGATQFMDHGSQGNPNITDMQGEVITKKFPLYKIVQLLCLWGLFVV